MSSFSRELSMSHFLAFPMLFLSDTFFPRVPLAKSCSVSHFTLLFPRKIILAPQVWLSALSLYSYSLGLGLGQPLGLCHVMRLSSPSDCGLSEGIGLCHPCIQPILRTIAVARQTGPAILQEQINPDISVASRNTGTSHSHSQLVLDVQVSLATFL